MDGAFQSLLQEISVIMTDHDHLRERFERAMLVASQALGTPEMPHGEADLKSRIDLFESDVDSLALLRVIFKEISAGILVLDEKDRPIYWNRNLRLLFGLRPSELKNRGVLEALADCLEPEHRVLLLNPPSPNLQCSFPVPDMDRYISLRQSPWTYQSQQGRILVFADVTEWLEHSKRLEELAEQETRDTLTGLYNRKTMTFSIEEALAPENRELSVLYIDLDRFSILNDGFGSGTGDSILRICADRFASVLPDGWQLGRWSADEFVAIQKESLSPLEIIRTADIFLSALHEPIHLALEDNQMTELPVSCTIGAAVLREDHKFFDEIIRDASEAVHHARNDGYGGLHICETPSKRNATERAQIFTALRRTIDKGELEVHYQPIIHLEERRIYGCEALVRWRHPEKGLISPVDFIPVAEDSGLIVPLGWSVLEKSLHDLKEFLTNKDTFTLSVNLSANQVRHRDTINRLREALTQSAIDPGCLQLELTESTMLEKGETGLSLLHEFRAMGMRLALDDFGTGFSSLGYLHRLPVQTLKIDRSFIIGLPKGEGSSKLVRAILGLGESLGMQTVAEGVEDPAQLHFLRMNGCQLIQGFLFSKALPKAEFIKFYEEFDPAIIPGNRRAFALNA